MGVELRALSIGSEVRMEYFEARDALIELISVLARFIILFRFRSDEDSLEDLRNKEFADYVYIGFNQAGLKIRLLRELESEEKAKVVGYSFYKGSVDNVMRLPFGKSINLRCTSEDVIHGFRVPGLGVKIDCIPGRINANKIIEVKSGVYFGQCHALCGTHHSSIPIRVDLISRKDFADWLSIEGKKN